MYATFLSYLRAITRWINKEGRKHLWTQSVRVVTGFLAGLVVDAVWHLVFRDVTFSALISQQRTWLESYFDGFVAYRDHLQLAALPLVVLVALFAWRFPAKCFRSWIASNLSLLPLISLCWALNWSQFGVKWGWSFRLILATVLFEAVVGFRRDMRLLQASASRLDPISEPEDDLIGRQRLLEKLETQILKLQTPVIGLTGEYGDGKTSVLNLLGKRLADTAVVVSFSAWLPGSEETLVSDLFGDIVVECQRFVHIPQLRKRARGLADIIGGSVKHLSLLSGLFPKTSQRQEIAELVAALEKVPRPIAVLIDEIDRMERDEALALLKVLRGIPRMKNITFVCAFSQTRLEEITELTPDELEKYFSVLIKVPPPRPEAIKTSFTNEIINGLTRQSWFNSPDEASNLENNLSELWTQVLESYCTNFRKAELLVNDTLAAAADTSGEVNVLDLILVNLLKRYHHKTYHKVSTEGAAHLIQRGGNVFDLDRDERKAWLTDLQALAASEPKADAILALLFPNYRRGVSRVRAFAHGTEDPQLRVTDPQHFAVYFRGELEEDIFTRQEMRDFLEEVNASRSEGSLRDMVSSQLRRLDQLPNKRSDFLWKLGLSASKVDSSRAIQLAASLAIESERLPFDIMRLGDGSTAVNVVFSLAQATAEPTLRPRILTEAMRTATHDQFAHEILQFSEDKDKNHILTRWEGITLDELRNVFLERMRKRYDPTNSQAVTLDNAYWYAFRRWALNSEEDKKRQQQFWREFIREDEQRLIQAIDFIYPASVHWSDDPKNIVNDFLPLEELVDMIDNLGSERPQHPAFVRIKSLTKGNYQKSPPVLGEA